MSATGFQFDAQQSYQLAAIAAVVDVFDGQPPDAQQWADKLASQLHATLPSPAGQLALDTAQEIGAIGNHLVLDSASILANVQAVQERNLLDASASLGEGALEFDIEMETGTGKTYVYLRTALELAKRYRFHKFLVVVPRKAIKEGVMASIRAMQAHFTQRYGPFEFFLYDGGSPEQVRSFATSTLPQIGVVSIDAMKREGNVMFNAHDKLLGLAPLEYLKATRPIVIVDEPQLMESDLSLSAIDDLQPTCVLRYSATHKKIRNLIYRLDPVDAHELGLVKQIVVSEVMQKGADAAPYIKLLAVQGAPKWAAKLELACRKADGSLTRKEKTIKQNADLGQATGNAAYDGLFISNLSLGDGAEPSQIELNRYGVLHEGQALGGATGLIAKEMIRETVREHIRKEKRLRSTPSTANIKVLSLFFVDKVASFLGEGSNSDDANGEFVRWFDEVYAEERAKDPALQDWLPAVPQTVRRGIFSSKAGRLADSTDKGNAQDQETFKLIMREKETLLDPANAVRFIFSHSMLGVGWDNPNVFQICALREMGKETERRQTLGRGLRLPVAKTVAGYQRVADRSMATLSVIANESYQDFADKLQKEYQDAGVAIGVVRKTAFAKITQIHAEPEEDGTAPTLGVKTSTAIFEQLQHRGFIDAQGQVQAAFTPQLQGFTLGLDAEFAPYETAIKEEMSRANMGRFVKPNSQRQKRKLNKELYATPEFAQFWQKISQKTTYRVAIDSRALIAKVTSAIKDAPAIAALRIAVTQAKLSVQRGGTKSTETRAPRQTHLQGSYDLPDIISELQQATSLTRQTLVDILAGCGKLDQFIGNPNDFIAMARRCIKGELAKIMVDGLQYEKLDGSVYELRELQADGLAEKELFLNQMYQVQNQQKTDFDWLLYDGGAESPERKFAELLDGREDIKLFMKLPDKFKIPTPVGPYNPDWAIIKQVDGENRVYMVRETKSTGDLNALYSESAIKVKAAHKHFAAIGVPYDISTPGAWNL